MLKGIFSRFGKPITVVSDNGPSFDSKESNEFSETYGFDHATSSLGYPRANGQVERTVQTVKQLLNKAKATNGDPHLTPLVYRTTPHEVTDVAPAHLLVGRMPRCTLPATRAHLLPKEIKYETVANHYEARKERQAQHYNNYFRAKPMHELNPGDHVLLRNKRL